MLSLPALLGLWRIPDVREVDSSGRFAGDARLGRAAGHVQLGGRARGGAGGRSSPALFLTTPFSFTGTHALLRGPVKKLDLLGRLKARLAAWREAREQERLRRAWRRSKRRDASPFQRNTGAKERKNDPAVAKNAEAHDAEEEKSDSEPGVVLVLNEHAPPPAKKSAAEPKIAKGATGFKLPSTGLLRLAERSEKIEED